MSLFGGDGSAPPSQSPYESENEPSQPSEPSSPSIDGHVSPPSAQHPSGVHHATESGEDDDLLTDSSSGSDESEEELPTRPNRFIGAPATWLSHTAADRQIATSLEQIQNKDLAAHLYNAHGLKHRVRRPAEDLSGLSEWQSREHWLKRGIELEYTDASGELQTQLVPSRDWTAWPLPPARIPTYREQPSGFAGNDGNEWRIGGAGVQDAGDELREELLATFLRQATERWNSRETEDIPTRERERITQSRSRSRSKSARSARSTSRTDVHMKDDDDRQTDNADTQDEDEHITGKRRGRKPRPETFLKPTFLADDERALRILQPAINSVLSKLDNLALAVRRTRLNHFGRGTDSDMSSHSEFTSGTESSELSYKPSSRSQPGSRTGRKRSARPRSRGSSVKGCPTSLKARITAQSNLSHIDYDSDSSLEINTAKEPSVSRTPSRPRSSTNERTPSVGQDNRWGAGLMDWSEVLGLAAAQGWNESAVSRTARRCAALFGESMSLMPLEEGLATKPTAEPVQYTPSTIPAPDILSMKSSNPPKRPYFRTGTLRCPHVDCYGYEKDFEMPYRVVQHCVRVHGYDPRTNDSDNEDRMVGGVHIDGFLQPIAIQQGWRVRGKSRASSEKRKEHEAGDSGDAMVVDSD